VSGRQEGWRASDALLPVGGLAPVPVDGLAPALPARRAGSGAGDRAFAVAAHAAGLFVLLLLGSIIVLLFVGGLPAFRAFGPGFLASSAWNPVTERFGALVSVYGTVASAVLALLMAVPMAFGVAFFLTELAPGWLRRPVGTAVELLAAVPSIIYGMWGFFVLAPAIGRTVKPWLAASLGHVPGLAGIFRAAPGDSSIFTAAVVLAIMITPFIAATMRDVFLTVPVIFKESAFGLGCTSWEVMRRIVLPYTRASVVGGIMLGLGRALGETMAVTFVIGNTNRISPSIFAPGNTIASLVALEFPEAESGSLQLSALLALGFILFVISFVVLAISRTLLVQRVRH
jgi:phosphate transport system permease protein